MTMVETVDTRSPASTAPYLDSRKQRCPGAARRVVSLQCPAGRAIGRGTEGELDAILERPGVLDVELEAREHLRVREHRDVVAAGRHLDRAHVVGVVMGQEHADQIRARRRPVVDQVEEPLLLERIGRRRIDDEEPGRPDEVRVGRGRRGQRARGERSHDHTGHVPDRMQPPGLELGGNPGDALQEGLEAELREMLQHEHDGRRHQPLAPPPRLEQLRGPREGALDELSRDDVRLEVRGPFEVDEAGPVEDRREGRRGEARDRVNGAERARRLVERRAELRARRRCVALEETAAQPWVEPAEAVRDEPDLLVQLSQRTARVGHVVIGLAIVIGLVDHPAREGPVAAEKRSSGARRTSRTSTS